MSSLKERFLKCMPGSILPHSSRLLRAEREAGRFKVKRIVRGTSFTCLYRLPHEIELYNESVNTDMAISQALRRFGLLVLLTVQVRKREVKFRNDGQDLWLIAFNRTRRQSSFCVTPGHMAQLSHQEMRPLPKQSVRWCTWPRR